jgi:hypothetical protein
MASHFEDDEHTRFIQAGDLPVLSNAAFMLHTSGMVNAYRDGHPGFISDDYLEAITAETSATALELTVAGLWERVDDGYVVHDDEAVKFINEMHLRNAAREDACLEAGGHFPNDENPPYCSRCFVATDEQS